MANTDSQTLNALVTGGSKGIGKAICSLFAEKGIHVIAPRREDLDLSNPASIRAFTARLTYPVHILVNNAGINPVAGLESLTDAEIDATVQVNLLAPLMLMQAVAGQMKKNKSGKIVNISSIWSAAAKNNRIIYSAAKAGINAMTRSAAVELAPHNILVNAVAPGYTNTDLTVRNNSPAELEAIRTQIPLGRLAEPREIAELVWFLSSPSNTYITGQTVFIDGGYISV